MTDKVTHYDYYKAIPRTAFDKRAVKNNCKLYKDVYFIDLINFYDRKPS